MGNVPWDLFVLDFMRRSDSKSTLKQQEVFYMKKFMSLLLVGIMMLSLVACGKSGGGKGELNVGVFYYTYSDTYISSVRTALDNALTEAGIKFQNYDGNSNQTTQNEQIDTAIAQGTNLLIVNIVTSGSVDASQAIVDKASAAGISAALVFGYLASLVFSPKMKK